MLLLIRGSLAISMPCQARVRLNRAGAVTEYGWVER